MESTRQKKVARLVQKELAEIILHHSGELAPGKNDLCDNSTRQP
jgi:hypothetical protein